MMVSFTMYFGGAGLVLVGMLAFEKKFAPLACPRPAARARSHLAATDRRHGRQSFGLPPPHQGRPNTSAWPISFGAAADQMAMTTGWQGGITGGGGGRREGEETGVCNTMYRYLPMYLSFGLIYLNQHQWRRHGFSSGAGVGVMT